MTATQALYFVVPILIVGVVAFRGWSGAASRSPATALAEVEAGALLVDVRSPVEFQQGHLRGAINVPVGQLARVLGTFDVSRPIVVYCRSGARSASAARELTHRGFRVTDLGPITAWPRAGDIVR